MMTEKISPDQDSGRKHHVSYSVQMSSTGQVSIFYIANPERAEVAKSWKIYSGGHAFFLLMRHFVPHDIEVMLKEMLDKEELDLMLKEVMFDGEKVILRTSVPKEFDIGKEMVRMDLDICEVAHQEEGEEADFDPDV